MDQNRHKVKRQRSNKRLESSPKMNEQNLHHQHCHMDGRAFSSVHLHPGVRHDSKGLMENPWQARGAALGGVWGPMDVCTHVRVGHIKELCSQTPLLSPSCQSPSAAVHVPGGSGGALTPALCGWRGHQSGQDPENPPHTCPTLRHSCHTAVDMLSPGDMPSSMGCSVDCGLEADRLTLGG